MSAITTRLHKIATSELVDITGGSQSINEWSEEVMRVYHRGNCRPELMVLVIERYGECYKGALYITVDDFEKRQ